MCIGNLIGQGRTAEVFEWKEDKAVKLFYKEHGLEQIMNEYNIAKLLLSKDLPVATVYDLIEVDKRLGIVYEKLENRTLMDMLMVDESEVEFYARLMAKLHNSIHVDISCSMDKQKNRIKQCIKYTDMLSDSVKEYIYKYIDNLEEGVKLCHGDLHPFNILFNGDRAVIIDWMTATIGNPLADVARTCLMFKYAVVPEEILQYHSNIFDKSKMQILEYYLDEYTKITGVSKKDIKRWELPMAAARLIEGIPMDEKKILIDFINKQVCN